jgi:signal transduction histidine kinase/CHASE2 domain-containing sensor protein
MSSLGKPRTWSQTFSLGAILFVLVVAFSTLPLIRDSQVRLTDTFFRLAPPPKERSPVVLVLIDDESLRQYGRWPWSRELLAQLTRNLAHAKASVIGLDILLSEPQSPAADKALADALHEARTVIVDKIGAFPDGPHWIEPLPQFSQAAATVGHAHSVLDADSICRHFPPRELTLDGSRWAFAVELARLIAPHRTATFLSAYGVPFADDTHGVSTATPVLARIRYRRDGFDTISARSVLEGADLTALRARPVLIGFGPTEIGDRISTPLTSELPAPGVEVHAQILDSILSGRTLHEVSIGLAAGILLIACVVAILVFRKLRGWTALLMLLGMVSVIYAGGLLTFLWISRLLPVGPVMLAFLLAPLLVYSADFVTVERSVTRQLLGLRFWLASRSKDGSSQDKGDLSWKLDLLHNLQTELGTLYELHKTLLESTQDLVAIFDERGRLLLNNQLFAALCQPGTQTLFTLDQLRARLKPTDGPPVLTGPAGLEGEVYLGSELYSLRTVPLPPTTISPGGGTIVTMTSLRTRMERDRARSEALGFITHELRTPLVSIQGFAELLMRYPSSPSCAAAPETIFRESKRLLALINSYLDVLRLDAGAKPISGDLLEVDDVIRKVFDILQPLAAAAQMQLLLDSGEPVPMIGDATLISGAVLNLVSNAIKYGRPGTDIRVSCLRENEEVTISVENEGEPIAAGDIPHVFDSYYRASQVETGRTGWGLGLAFVKRIAEKHGGSVSVQSRHAGNCFYIHLPAKVTVAAATAKETV